MDYNVNLARSSWLETQSKRNMEKIVELCGVMLLNSPRGLK